MYYEKSDTIKKSESIIYNGKYIGGQYGVKFKDNVAGTPLATNYAKNSLPTDLDGHVQKDINKFKTVDLKISGAGGTMGWFATDSSFGNWRTTAGINVKNEVLPRLDTTVIGFSCTQEFEPFWDKITGNQIVSLIDKAASAARMFAGETTSAIYVPAYQKMPVLKGIGTLECMSSVKFNFEFGQAGLYNALEEVVKPVIAIAKSFMPRGGGTQTWGNAPSIEYALNETVKSFIAEVKKKFEAAAGKGTITSMKDIEELVNATPNDETKQKNRQNAGLKELAKGDADFANKTVDDVNTAKNDIDSANAEAAGKTDEKDKKNEKLANADTEKAWLESAAKGVAEVLTGLQDFIYTALNNTASGMLGKYTGVVLRIGRFQTPSMIVKDVKFEFDFEEVDENGFPSKGSVELGGLESVKSAYGGLINSPSSDKAENSNEPMMDQDPVQIK